MSLFKERIPYKPFEYPIYYTEGWLKQAQAFWLHTEIPMSGDVKDWNEKLTKSERMRQNNRVNPKLAKIIARKKYGERQIDKWVKWSWQQRGRVKYKELVGYQDQYNIKVYG